MTIVPILNRELVASARKPQLQAGRSVFAGMLLAVVLSTFGAWYYWEHGSISPELMGRVARQSFLWIVFIHGMAMFGVSTAAAHSIAAEKDRRTLDFLLATQLSNAEIVVGKLASSLTLFFSTLAAGLPVMLLLNTLGSIEIELILLTYASLTCMAFFLASLSIWVSTGARDGAHAARGAVLLIMGWLMGPFFIAFMLPRWGYRVPQVLQTANSWILFSTPMSLILKMGGGFNLSSGLIDAIVRMCALQLIGGALFLVWAIFRLRSA